MRGVRTSELISAKYVGILRKTRLCPSFAVRPPPQIPGQTTFVHFPFIAVAEARHLPLPLTLCVFFKPVSSPARWCVLSSEHSRMRTVNALLKSLDQIVSHVFREHGIQRSAKVDAPGFVKAAGKLGQQ